MGSLGPVGRLKFLSALDPAVITYLNQVQQQIQQNAISPAVKGVKQVYNQAFHTVWTMSRHRLFAALALLPMSLQAADTTRFAACEEMWRQTYAASATAGGQHDTADLIKKWVSLAAYCEGSGVYEFRLAILYLASNRPQAALDLLKDAHTWPVQYAKLAPFVRLRAQLSTYASETPMPLDKIRALKPQYLAALADGPVSPTAYEQVSNYMLVIQEYRDAIIYAEKSLQLRSDQWEPNRTLTIAHEHLAEYAPAVFAGRRAQELRNSLISDSEFMYALAKSYAGAGNVKVAEMTLQILRQEKPDENGSANWQEAINFLAEQLKVTTWLVKPSYPPSA